MSEREKYEGWRGREARREIGGEGRGRGWRGGDIEEGDGQENREREREGKEKVGERDREKKS